MSVEKKLDSFAAFLGNEDKKTIDVAISGDVVVTLTEPSAAVGLKHLQEMEAAKENKTHETQLAILAKLVVRCLGVLEEEVEGAARKLIESKSQGVILQLANAAQDFFGAPHVTEAKNVSSEATSNGSRTASPSSSVM